MSYKAAWKPISLIIGIFLLGEFLLSSIVSTSSSKFYKEILPARRAAKLIQEFADLNGYFPQNTEEANNYLNSGHVLEKTHGYYPTPWGGKPFLFIQVPPNIISREGFFLQYFLGKARNRKNPISHLDLGALLYIPAIDGKSAFIYIIHDDQGSACPLGPVVARILH